jgi:hypothetical protein
VTVYRAFLGKMRVDIRAGLADAVHLPVRCTKEELAELRRKLDERLQHECKVSFRVVDIDKLMVPEGWKPKGRMWAPSYETSKSSR